MMSLLERIGLIILVAASAVSGVLALKNVQDLRCVFDNQNEWVVVSGIKSDPGNISSKLQVGDTLIAIDGTPIKNPRQADWLSTNLFGRDSVRLEIRRQARTSEIWVYPGLSHSIFFVLLNTLLGLLFVLVGILVGWGKRRDPTGRAYYRLTFVAGCSILLSIVESPWQFGGLHFLHSFVRLISISLIPPLLADFLLRFCQLRFRRIKRFLLYLPSVLIIPALLITYIIANQNHSPQAISAFHWIFNTLLGAFMAIYFSFSLYVVVRHYHRLKEQARRDQMRWLLIVTVVGLLPYFFYYRLPPVFGYEPIMPMWTVFSLMLIVPTGWGMAVASFRMLNVEWALSRTIIYTIAIILSSFFLLTLLLIFGEPYTEIRSLTLKTQITAGIIFLLISASGLSAPIRWVIDRLYFRDWFNEQEAVRQLGEELSKALIEKEIVEILTVRLPELIKVRQIALVSAVDGRFRLSGQRAEADTSWNERVINIVQQSLTGQNLERGKYLEGVSDNRLAGLGFDLLLPLRHHGQYDGALLIGRKKSGALFSDKDFVVLNALSNHTASAIANIALTKQLVDQEKRALAVEMAGGIAHEINNSLAPLMGQAQLAEMKLRNNKVADSAALLPALDIVIRMSERIKRIASNLNRLSQPPALETESLTLESVADEAINIISETAGRIKYYSETNPDAPYKLRREYGQESRMIRGDRQQLGQVFLNLIVNAADALEEYGRGTITVGVQGDGNGLGVIGYVEDDGPGIPSEIQERILQPYFTTKIKGKGTGLGLAIVKQIIELHSGTLNLISSPGKGARFEFFIPCNSVDKLPVH